ARRWARGLRRRHGRADPVGLSRARRRDASRRPHRRDPGRHRQPARRAGRQLRHRVPLQLRPGVASRPRLRDPVPADGCGPGGSAAGPVRQGLAMTAATAQRAAIVVALLLLITLPWWVGGTYYVNIASQILLYAVFALALNVLVGYGGLVSLGHAGLFAIAGYTAALMMENGYGHLTGNLAGLVVVLAASAVFGLLALRATGIGFLLITLALRQIVWGIAPRLARLAH